MPTTAPITRRFARFNPAPATSACRGISICFLLLIPFLASKIAAQTADSVAVKSRELPAALVLATRFDRTGYNYWKADSLPAQEAGSVSDRLFLENAFDVRANAPGTLATLSARGAGPGRTPIFWNGLNLQSPMNGVVDAALLPLWPGDGLELRYGGQSAMQSSGSIGGSVLLEQEAPTFGKGWEGFIRGSGGSFGRCEASTSAGLSAEHFATKMRAAWQRAENNFSFRKQALDGKFYPAQQANNFLEKQDWQQFNRLKINERSILKTAFWRQHAFREIPPAVTESVRQTWQRDRATRAVASWECAPNSRSLWATRVAWLGDFLAFHLAGDTDTSRSRQVFLQTEFSATKAKSLAWRAGGTAIRQWAKVDGYADSLHWFGQTRLATFAMGEWRRGRGQISGLLRQEWTTGKDAPFTWSFGAQVGLGKAGNGQLHFSRNFNLPSFNDRYWRKLGNPGLRPEKGYSANIGWSLQQPGFLAEITHYQLLIDDWILWQPDSTGIFRPGNLQKVWGRGLESTMRVDWISGGWKLRLAGRAQISQTTHVAVYGGPGEKLGAQLPYTPPLSGSISMHVFRGAFSLTYFQQFTGERSDNNGKKLSGFSVGNLFLAYAFLDQRLVLDLRIENLWNERYEIIRYRPMPGTGWRLGGTLNFAKPPSAKKRLTVGRKRNKIRDTDG